MDNTLVVAGDRSRKTAVRTYLKLSIICIVCGFVLFAVAAYLLVTGEYIISYNSMRHADTLEFVMLLGTVISAIIIIAGFATPFLAIYQSEKCYIDVYEQYIKGAYLVQKKGSIDQYIPFQLTFEKIDGVSNNKNKVFIQTSSGTITCFAFNASEICEAIRIRCGK